MRRISEQGLLPRLISAKLLYHGPRRCDFNNIGSKRPRDLLFAIMNSCMMPLPESPWLILVGGIIPIYPWILPICRGLAHTSLKLLEGGNI